MSMHMRHAILQTGERCDLIVLEVQVSETE